MTRAARYGNVQPDVFEKLDHEEMLEVARRAQQMYVDDEKARLEALIEIHGELTKVLVKVIQSRPTL